MRFAAVIASAGLSSRMHEFKPLMYLDDMPVIDRVIGTLRQAGIQDITVVTGYRSEQLAPHLKALGVDVCYNPRYAETGMFESLCLGIQSLKQDCDGVFLLPGDVPLIQPDTIRRMTGRPEAMIRPVFQGKPGHPVLVRAEALPHLLAYRDGDGLRGAIRSFPGSVGQIDVEDPGVHLDADTPEDFRQLHRQARKNKGQGRLWADIQILLMSTEPVLSQESAQLLEMIEHTHSIASACACVHMSYSKGWKLLNSMEQESGMQLIERFAGGDGGGGTSLTPQGRQLLKNYQAYCAEVRAYAQQRFRERFAEYQNGQPKGATHESIL